MEEKICRMCFYYAVITFDDGEVEYRCLLNDQQISPVWTCREFTPDLSEKFKDYLKEIACLKQKSKKQ